MSEIKLTVVDVDASHPRKSETGVERGVDVDVTIELSDGRTLDGEVTLLPCADGRPGYETWGDRSNWLDNAVLRVLQDELHEDDCDDAMVAIASAAASCAERETWAACEAAIRDARAQVEELRS